MSLLATKGQLPWKLTQIFCLAWEN